MQEMVGVDQKASDAELMILLRRAQEEIDAHAELNEVNLLLLDFARELLKKRLLNKCEVRADDGVGPARAEYTHIIKKSSSVPCDNLRY